ncbi:HD domain-containing protein [Patescibacteria group bacterium]|nr:HD domain-containing protein [Patescibacteria group bacterium]
MIKEYLKTKDIKSKYILRDILEDLEKVEDKKEHHPEKNVLHHSLQCAKLALTYKGVALWQAALLHDIGKVIHRLEHAKYGADILRYLRDNNKHIRANLRETCIPLVENHSKMIAFYDMTFGTRKKFMENFYFGDLCKLYNCDRGGRKPNAQTESLEVMYDKIVLFADKTLMQTYETT